MDMRLTVIALVSTAGIAACAATPVASTPPPALATDGIVATAAAPGATSSDIHDQAYMARVQQEAQRRGILVQWVAPPRKKPQLVASAP